MAEDAGRVGIGLVLLDDQSVVLTRIDIGAVLAHRLAALVERVRIERLGAGVGFLAALGENQFGERVARAAGRGRAIDLDRNRRQRRVDVLPGLRGIGLAARISGKRLVDVGGGQRDSGAVLGLGDGAAVDPHLLLDAVAGAVPLAGGLFGRP